MNPVKTVSTNYKYVVEPVPWSVDDHVPGSLTLPELLDEQAAIRPDAQALVAGEKRRTYQELADRVRTFAAGLDQLGVHENSAVALLAPNIEEWMVAAIGAMRLGAPVDAFNTWVRAWDLNHLLKASKIEYLIMVPTIRSTDLLAELKKLVPELWTAEPGKFSSQNFPSLKKVILIDEERSGKNVPEAALFFDEIMDATLGTDIPAVNAEPESPAVILYTSGTTQRPKAVPLEHRALIENGYAIGARMGLSADDRVWLGSPLFWSFGCANAAMAAMTHGACLVLQERFTPEAAVQLLADEQCTAAYLLPSISGALVEEVPTQMRALVSLRTGLVIGRPEEVRQAAVELDIPELCNVYGSTETYGNCCVTPHTMPLEERLICQGPPLPGMALRVVDMVTGERLPPGTQGELQVKGRVTTGYIGNQEATEQAFTDDGWYRTGDTGQVLSDGSVQFVSRHTDMIKSSGINISPAEVESFIAEHTAVSEVAVVGAPHTSRGEVAVAFVVTHADAIVTAQEIREFCKSSTAGYKVPWAVEIVDEIPRTPTGKMMRKDLRSSAVEVVNSMLLEQAEQTSKRT